MSCASLRPTRPLGARSLALLRRFTAVPRSPASMMRCTCRSGTPVTDAASFAVIRVADLVATLKSFHIFGKIYDFYSQFASALDCWVVVRSSARRASRSRPIWGRAMLPVPGLRFLQHLRPGTAEVSLRHLSGSVIGGCGSSDLTVDNAVPTALRSNGTLSA